MRAPSNKFQPLGGFAFFKLPDSKIMRVALQLDNMLGVLGILFYPDCLDNIKLF
jgi:hypothetical protein